MTNHFFALLFMDDINLNHFVCLPGFQKPLQNSRNLVPPPTNENIFWIWVMFINLPPGRNWIQMAELEGASFHDSFPAWMLDIDADAVKEYLFDFQFWLASWLNNE